MQWEKPNRFRSILSKGKAYLAPCLLAVGFLCLHVTSAGALTYADLVWGETRLVREPVRAARISWTVLGLQSDQNEVIDSLDVQIVIPLSAPRAIEVTIGISEGDSNGASAGTLRQRVRIGGDPEMGQTVRDQIANIPNPKLVASVCESLLVSGFRAELLRVAVAGAAVGQLRDMWVGSTAQQAIIGLAGHCLYATTRMGIAARNPLVRAGLVQSQTQSQGHTSQDMAVSIKGRYFNSHVNTKSGDDFTSTQMRLVATTVEGKLLDATRLYSISWEGNPATGHERTIYFARNALKIDKSSLGLVGGKEDLVLTRDGKPPSNISAILRATDTPNLLVLKHVLESEASLRQAALFMPPVAKKDIFDQFWRTILPEIDRKPVLQSVSEELAFRYKPANEDLQIVQQSLAVLGHYNAAIDGETGPATRAAIRAFESSIGSSPDGYLTSWELAQLAPELLEPGRLGPSTSALRTKLMAAADARRAAAESKLGLPKPNPVPEAKANFIQPFEIAARIESETARNKQLKRDLAEMQQKLRLKKTEVKQRLTETRYDLAQCYCAGRLECLSTAVELPYD
jgi:hypothetical protein